MPAQLQTPGLPPCSACFHRQPRAHCLALRPCTAAPVGRCTKAVQAVHRHRVAAARNRPPAAAAAAAAAASWRRPTWGPPFVVQAHAVDSQEARVGSSQLPLAALHRLQGRQVAGRGGG